MNDSSYLYTFGKLVGGMNVHRIEFPDWIEMKNYFQRIWAISTHILPADPPFSWNEISFLITLSLLFSNIPFQFMIVFRI